MKNTRKTSGYSLLELLIAMSLGVFVIGTTLHFFDTTRKTQRVQNDVSEVRENVKFALDIIKEDVQLAGFYGCATRWADSSLINTLNNPTDFRWNFSQAIFGSEYSYSVNSTPAKTWSPTLDNTITNSNIFQGDTLTIRHAGRQEFGVVSHSTSTDSIRIKANNRLKQYDYILVTDCEHSSIIQKTNTDNTQAISHSVQGLDSKFAGNASVDLGKRFSNKSKVMKVLSITYFIAKPDGKTPALYRKESSRNAEEILTGIVDMQVEYGIDTDANGTVDEYQTADVVNDNNNWANVLAVKLSLTAQGFDDSSSDASFSNGQDMRYEISTTVNLRNRIP